MTKEGFIDEAVLMVDVQKDFCPGGKLAVREGDLVVEPLNTVGIIARRTGRSVLKSRDYHPEVTTHFQKYGGVWPEHCVQGTDGADFHDELVHTPGDIIISKGMGEREDAYSAFQGLTPDNRPFIELLKERQIRKLYVGGLATDYCVGSSVQDALKLGFDVVVLTDAIRAVNLKPTDEEEALQKMVELGAQFKTSKEVITAWLLK